MTAGKLAAEAKDQGKASPTQKSTAEIRDGLKQGCQRRGEKRSLGKPGVGKESCQQDEISLRPSRTSGLIKANMGVMAKHLGGACTFGGVPEANLWHETALQTILI
jgi:hypothetical protein